MKVKKKEAVGRKITYSTRLEIVTTELKVESDGRVTPNVIEQTLTYVGARDTTSRSIARSNHKELADVIIKLDEVLAKQNIKE